MDRRWPGLLVTGALCAAMLPATAAAAGPTQRGSQAAPEWIEGQRISEPIVRTGDEMEWSKTKLQGLREARGPQRVIVRLSAQPSVLKAGSTQAAQKDAYATARAQQARVIAQAKAIDSSVEVLGRTGRASNVVMLKADKKTLTRLAKSRDVVAIVPVKDYELDLSETVPYVGGTIVQNSGWKGQGVDIAIFDSGTDYTHAALGGAGTEAAFKAAYGDGPDDPKNTIRNGLFPTSKIKGGYDFVGEAWPGTELDPADEAPDPDPIDSPDSGTTLGVAWGTDGGHGTHVADIIGGTKGMASRANLFSVKVCSSISTSCSGIALLNAMDWALDPNGDGSVADHVDIIHMSLGSDYGIAYDDDLSYAVQRATSAVGMLTIASAGNGANKPYIAGTPASAQSALSVAQTQVPSAKKYPLVISAPAAIAGTYKNVETVDWAPLDGGLSGDVVYIGGNGCPGSVSYPAAGSLTGKVALIDRGTCSVSLKTDGAAKAGAIGVLIGLVAPGDAVAFSYGGGEDFVPTLVIQQDLSSAIKTQLAIPATVTVSASDAVSVSLVHGMAGTSSRGPSMVNKIKPEIGAPGASVSAVSGGGTATQAFGGTSGAAPMVTGAAAMIKSAFPSRSGLEIKAVLMNTAEMDVYTDNALQPGVKAPITRIGGGELRVNRALKAPIAVWNIKDQSAALSFGFVDGTADKTLIKYLRVKNYTTKSLTFKIKPTFRYANDKANGAVTVTGPTSITLKPKQTKDIQVKLRLDASKLRAWTMNAGAAGVDPTQLDLLEYDGYITFDRVGYDGDNADPVHVPWHVLPRLSANVNALDGTAFDSGDALRFKNSGTGIGAVDVYSLVATSPDKPNARPGMNSPVVDIKAVGVQTWNQSCAAADDFLYTIAINQWDRRAVAPVPAEFDVYINNDDDPDPDYVVFTGTASGSLSDIRLLTWVYDLETDDVSAYYYADNSTNDPTTVLFFCGAQIGMTAADFGKPMTLDVEAYDWYFRDYALTDSVYGIEVAPMAERYGVSDWNGEGIAYSGEIDPGQTSTFEVTDFATEDGYTGNPSETGLLLVTNADRFVWHGAEPKGKETIQLIANRVR